MKIRTARQNDLSLMADLWQEQMTVIGKFSPRLRQSWPDRETWMGQTAECLQSPAYAFFVTDVDARCVGYIAGHILEAQSEICGIIDDIVLDTHKHYKGSASGLYAALQEWLEQQGVAQVVVNVPRYYTVPQAFWRALGAEEWAEGDPDTMGQLSPERVWMRL